MIENLPAYLPFLFVLTTLVALFFFYKAIRASSMISTVDVANRILIALILWLCLQAYLSYKGIYISSPSAIPPKIMLLGILPMLVTIAVLFATKSGRAFIDSLSMLYLTYLSAVRILVELVLLGLFYNKAVPEIMTFEGLNFDILAGLTAPLVAYFGLAKQKLSRRIVLGWNIICLALLFNIVVIALLSAPSPFQKLAFEQPNMAILYFPFSWLPTLIVPLVLFAHLVSIRQLLKQNFF